MYELFNVTFSTHGEFLDKGSEAKLKNLIRTKGCIGHIYEGRAPKDAKYPDLGKFMVTGAE